MKIAGLQKNTLIDFPGKIAATVFLSGCNFFCPWCYSPELVVPEKIKNHPFIPERDFFSFLGQRRGLLDGIVICGGEPTMNIDLPLFIKKIKDSGFAVKLDTNGSNPKMLKELIAILDYVAMDIKVPKGKYGTVLKNIKIHDIQDSINILKQGKVDFEFRSTIVPTIHTKEDVLKMAEWIQGKNIKYYLQKYRPEKTIDPSFEKIKPYSDEWMLEVQGEISHYFQLCQIRG
ncbi:anaerobic ribonucleoside-triphosphate reductase activating protein [Patescibacteria group bacterium]|nr:anaerobic ribonucleoside-triphosphate reductase activating protein [Patescibacteria group bacterium]